MSGLKKRTTVYTESKSANSRSKKKKTNFKNNSTCNENNILDKEKSRFEDEGLLDSAEFDQDSESKIFNIKSIDSVESNSPILKRQTEQMKSIDVHDVVDQMLFEKQKDFFKSPEVIDLLRHLKDS